MRVLPHQCSGGVSPRGGSPIGGGGLSGPGGGCGYRRDGTQTMTWPGALAATVSGDGRLVTVVRPDRVDLYEDTG